jgi:enamine deaminase RidA (YjgF/YER057c/UK114 family)
VGEQTQECIDLLDAALQLAGFSLEDVARTWFYNDDILAWYNEFNRVRTARYQRCSFSCGSLPASTAVSGKNPSGAALVLAAWAVRPGAGASVRAVASPLQCPAPQYGSAFSRATAVDSGGVRRLLVSGTASIEPGGKTVHLGDVPRQVELSMKVIAAILEAHGMSWADVTRASAYCKRPEYVAVFREWQLSHGQMAMPVVPVYCDICRGDLLFELELDALQRSGSV